MSGDEHYRHPRAVEGALVGAGFVLAAIGVTNAMPAYGVLPDFGVYPAAILYPVALGLGLLIAFLGIGRFTLRARDIARTAFLGLLLAGAAYALWRYYVDVTRLQDVGLFFFQPMHAWVSLAGCVIILVYCWFVWGAPLALIGSLALAYFFTGQYWPGILAHPGMDFVQDTPNELWFNTGDGVLGQILSILVNTVLPFIVLGAMLEGTGGGRSLIKLGFHAMRRFRGGPAHAAIMASGLFGTISGSAVANVVGTGVITIPMIRRRGFSPAFAGGVEATASTGGQIMPPIMGAAALVMADFIGINYLLIVVAAIVPALAYYASLFATVIFEARRLGLENSPEEDVEPIVGQDWINLILVAGPIVTVVTALIAGASPAGSAMLALLLLVALSFLNPDIRRAPSVILLSLAQGGINFGRLLVATGVVGIIVSVLGATGLPLEFAKTISGAMTESLLVMLVLAALASLVLGMGMPTLPAYLTIAIMLGPALKELGLTDLTSHFFVFYFGVASAITPPVAIAAYAAAAIANAGALSTAVQASRVGIVIFAIPFLFAFNPIMLIVSEAGADWNLPDFLFMILQLAVMCYMLASAGARFDRRRMALWEVAARVAVGLAVIHPDHLVSAGVVAAAAGLIVLHYLTGPRKALA